MRDGQPTQPGSDDRPPRPQRADYAGSGTVSCTSTLSPPEVLEPIRRQLRGFAHDSLEIIEISTA
jgi:hypothetical protein